MLKKKTIKKKDFFNASSDRKRETNSDHHLEKR